MEISLIQSVHFRGQRSKSDSFHGSYVLLEYALKSHPDVKSLNLEPDTEPFARVSSNLRLHVCL